MVKKKIYPMGASDFSVSQCPKTCLALLVADFELDRRQDGVFLGRPNSVSQSENREVFEGTEEN